MFFETENTLSVSQGVFELHRFPQRPREQLRAWDAADEYILEFLAENELPESDSRVLIVNDTFGALAVTLSHCQPHALSDSYLSQLATRFNLAANNLPENSVKLLNSLEKLEGVFDLVLIKAPKTLALLEDELIRLSFYMTSASKVVLAGMVKSLSPSIWKLLERLVGPTTTSLARKKARLIFASPESGRVLPVNPYPVYYRLEKTDYLIGNHANVFSRDSLDIGTRFFLQHLPTRPDFKEIIDLGCGNGLVGLIAAQRNTWATVHFVDESFMAVTSAEDNFNRIVGANRKATFAVGDGLMGFASDSADLILCNPPFHQQNSIGDQIAVSMFKQSSRVLRKNGELWVIGNRHLNYSTPLARLFGKLSIVASNSKFIILKASQLKTRIRL
jgi:16S rRNA (guanine1207-N2)-methyltransferase